MTGVEVLAPVRLETRFVAPTDRTDGGTGWQLRLRVYPDEFSIKRGTTPPSIQELDRLADAVTSMAATPPIDEAAAFASFATSVGAARAFRLWRTHVIVDAAGGTTVDRTGQVERNLPAPHPPTGLPERLEVWFVHDDGTRKLVHTLQLDLAAIAADLDLSVLADPTNLAPWWLSYVRAKAVGLGADLDLGPTPPRLDALVVLGTGDTEAGDLVDAHNAAGRLAVLAQGTPTNTVEGEPTTDFGDDPDAWYPLLSIDPSTQPATREVLTSLTGSVAATALPMLGGEIDSYGPGSLAVQGLWPALWGRSLRDVIGAGAYELELARWAIRRLAVEGPLPAIRVGEQPYGLLPTSAFAAWRGDGDEHSALEERILAWAVPWRAGAADAARTANAWVRNAGTGELLDILGLHAPNRHWRARPVADLHLVQAIHALHGMPLVTATEWDRATARVWRNVPFPVAPITAAGGRGAVPGTPLDLQDRREKLWELLGMDPEMLYYRPGELGLLGHMYRESMLAVRAVIGAAHVQWSNEQPVELGTPLPLDEIGFRDFVMRGTDRAADDLRGDENGQLLVQRFDEVREALGVMADMWDQIPEQSFGAVLAALDTAAFRVDPWLTGVAARRLRQLADADAPFRLGAYGWVDAPAPYDGVHDRLAPGPTAAGLLHAPSHGQALTAALLRDAAVRYPDDKRWRLDLDSSKVREAAALAERVRLGVHPYEALGLEVERIAGTWDNVRLLRKQFPLAENQQLRRVCDGAKVLDAARKGTLPPGLPPDLPARLAPLDHVLDTYADLLVADGIHALVSGRADLANTAMEAAAGLGAPSELRAIRTPRAATTVRVTTWVLLPPGQADPGKPVTIADPAFAAIVANGEDPESLARILGGGEDAPIPSLTGDGEAADPSHANERLQAAMITDLKSRLNNLIPLAPPGELRNEALAAAAGQPSLHQLRQLIRRLVERDNLPILPIVKRSLLPSLIPAVDLDERWLEIVAAVRPRLAALEARQLSPARWPGAVAAPNGTTDPWHPDGPVLVAYGPAVPEEPGVDSIAVALVDAWTDSVPSRRHTTTAAFGFNGPKSRAPQAILLAVPPDPTERLDNTGLLDVVLETRELAHARGARPSDREGLPYATPGPLVHYTEHLNFLQGWPR